MTVATLVTLLSILTDSLKSATASLPEQSAIAIPADGISLLNTKNELFLSYLQNLVFLIILKLKDVSQVKSEEQSLNKDNGIGTSGNIRAEVVKKLVELRVYLEKGVKPLEGRLRYQIDKVIRAAEDEATNTAANIRQNKGQKNTTEQANGHIAKHASRNGNGSDDTDTSEDSDSDTSAPPPTTAIDPLAYRPNPSALTLPSRSNAQISTKPDGIYRPPRITPTALPTTTSRLTSTSKPSKSATLDEFVATELSTAPVAEPSIGSTIASAGRRNKTAKEREAEREMRAYEESNYLRLPTEGKKKKKGGSGREGYGGEEWRGLGEGADRVVRLTGKGKAGALEKSRKRGREERGGEVRMGEVFEKRRRGVEGRRGRR